MGDKPGEAPNGHKAGRKIKGKSRPRKRAGKGTTSPHDDMTLFSQEIQSHSDSDKMAASRVDSSSRSRRLCVRYKYYFLVAVLILSLQLFIISSFLGINQNEVLKDEPAITVNDRHIVHPERGRKPLSPPDQPLSDNDNNDNNNSNDDNNNDNGEEDGYRNMKVDKNIVLNAIDDSNDAAIDVVVRKKGKNITSNNYNDENNGHILSNNIVKDVNTDIANNNGRDINNDKSSNVNNRRRHSNIEDRVAKKTPVLGLSLPAKDTPSTRPTPLARQDYTPKCKLSIKETLDAINRASSSQCKQALADIGCLLQSNKLYKQRLPKYCPSADGNKQGVYYGCYRDKQNARDLEGGNTDFPEDNTPQKCIDFCLHSGEKYAGVQYTKECWCGSRYGRHSLRLEEANCYSICPGNRSETCGSYLTSKIFSTGASEIVRQPVELAHAPVNETVPRVKIVFILTMNGRAVRQVVRLIRILYSPEHFYYIHVDKRQEFLYRELLPLQERFHNIMVTTKRFATIWGGASLLSAHLSFINELLMERPLWKWDYYINLSESDYPIKPLSTLVEYLTAYKGINFIKSHGGQTSRFLKKQGMDKTFYECDNHLWRVGDRELPKGIMFDGGSDWIGLHRDFAKYVVSSKDDLLTGLKDMYQYALLPVESFFHVVIQNSVFCGKSADNNLHVTNWRRKQGCQCQYKHIVDWCGCSPNVIMSKDLDRLLTFETKPAFFARKFEALLDQEVLNSLDVALFGYLQQTIPGISSYWQNVYHHLDKSTKIKDSALTIYNSLFRRSMQQLAKNTTSCNLTSVKLLEVNVYSYKDKFQGLLVMGSAQVKATGETLTLEIHSRPNHFFTVVDAMAGRDRLMAMEVGTDYDLKERIFRNYGNLIGPYDDISLHHVWSSGTAFTASVAWVDPTNIIAASYEVNIQQSAQRFIGNQKPHVNRPLRPGIWSAKIMVNLKLVGETQFLVTPLMFNTNKPASYSDILRFHHGPVDKYTSVDFSEFMPNLGLKDIPMLKHEARENSQKAGEQLENWIDSLTSKFWVLEQMCILHGSGVCNHLPECNTTSWSSRFPDMKSDLRYVGTKMPLSAGKR